MTVPVESGCRKIADKLETVPVEATVPVPVAADAEQATVKAENKKKGENALFHPSTSSSRATRSAPAGMLTAPQSKHHPAGLADFLIDMLKRK